MEYHQNSVIKDGKISYTLVENPHSIGGVTYAQALGSDGCTYNVVWTKKPGTRFYDWENPDFNLLSNNE